VAVYECVTLGGGSVGLVGVCILVVLAVNNVCVAVPAHIYGMCMAVCRFTYLHTHTCTHTRTGTRTRAYNAHAHTPYPLTVNTHTRTRTPTRSSQAVYVHTVISAATDNFSATVPIHIAGRNRVHPVRGCDPAYLLYVCKCAYTDVCVCMYVCTHIHIHVCMYVCTHKCTCIQVQHADVRVCMHPVRG